MVTLFWLSEKISQEKITGSVDLAATNTSKFNIDNMNFEAEEVNPNYDMIDRSKSFANQILEGKGASKWLTRGCLAVGLGEILSHGVTQYLVTQGIMGEAMGLFGVAKLGVAQLPALWTSICGGFTALAGFSPVLLGAGIGLAALATLPLIKRFADKIKQKHKDAQGFDKGIEKILKDQESSTLTI